MTDKTTSPRMGRFNPIRQFMLLQRYGQNNPWTYMSRVVVAVTLYGTVLVGICFGALGLLGGVPLSELWPWMLGAVLFTAFGGVLGGGVGLLMMRWANKKGTVPRDADPDTMRAAQRHLRKGVLSGDPETDRLARHLVPQAERSNSTRFLLLTFALVLGPFLLVQAGRLASGDADPFALVLAAVAVVIFAIAWPFARKHKRNARRFGEIYDAEHGPPVETTGAREDT